MTESTSQREPIEELAESFLARFRAGERPALSEFTAAHPELAEQIRELFPALLELEQAGSQIAVAPVPAAPHTDAGVATPKTFGDYRIIREVGRGGMGVVYEAVQESLGRHVALKVFAPWTATDSKLIERFQREARAAARLHHTNIVPVFGVGEHAGNRYYAMQFIHGQGLDAILHELRRLRPAPERNGTGAAPADQTRSVPLAATVAHSLLTGRFAARSADEVTPGTVAESRGTDFRLTDAPEAPASAAPSSDASNWASQPGASYARTVARVGLQVAEALAHAHGQGILHRDIKPSNLLLDIDGNMWVTDFGLAKSGDAEALTEAGDIVGTVRYMAPERFRGDSGPESDVYGLGVTLYELLTLRPAFGEADRARLIDHILHTDPPPPRTVDSKIPRDLETIVLKAMAKHPSDRYVSARSLAEDLERFLQDRTILARRSSVSERLWRWCKRNPLVATLNALAATLTIAIAIISTVAAIWLGQSRNKALENLRRATSAEGGRTRQLWESYHAQARARRFSHQVGQRFASLDALKNAAGLGVFPEHRGELRDEAIACMALPDLRLERSLGVSSGEGFATNVIAFDSALERFASDDSEGGMKLRKVDTGEVLGRLPGPAQPVASCLAFSPHGDWLLVGYDTRFLAWEVRGGVPGRVLTLAQGKAEFLGFGPDGRTAVLLRSDEFVTLVDLDSGRETRRLRLEVKPEGRRTVGHISPDSRRVALGDEWSRHVWLFDLETGAEVHRFELPELFGCLAWSPDSQLLAVSCDDRQIYIWETTSKRLISVLEGHAGAGTGLQFSHAGDLLISWSFGGPMQLWDPIRGRERLSAYGWFVALSDDDRRVAMINPDGQLEVHELATGRECRALHPGRVGNRSPHERWFPTEVEFRSDGRVLAANGDAVRLWDIATFTQIAQLPIGHSETARFRPDGTSLLTFGVAGLCLWPLKSGQGTGEDPLRIGPPRLADMPRNAYNAFARWDNAGRLIVATHSADHQAVLLDPATLAERRRFLRQVGLHSSVASPDGRWVATSTWGRPVDDLKVWDTTSGALAWELPCGNPSLGFSPDGRWLVTGFEREYRLWQVGSWEPGITVARSGTYLSATFAFTRNGGLLALNRGSLVRLVDPESGHELATLEPPSEYPRGVLWPCFSPDGGWLAVPTGPVILVWDLRLIRAQLARMGLDWDVPPIPGSETAPAPLPLRVHVEGANWFAEASVGEAQANAGHWAEAASSLARAVGQGVDDPLVWHRHLLLRLHAGDLAGYRAGCSALISRFGRVGRPGFVEPVAWACALGQDALADWRPLARAIESAVKQRPENSELRKTLGAVLIRAGLPREAIAALEESIRVNGHGGNAFDWLFLAMAHHRLGHSKQATAALASARDWIAHGDERAIPDPYIMSPLPWYTKLELEILLREAEGTISREPGKLPAEAFGPR
jgi:serine/threonine protein kinase